MEYFTLKWFDVQEMIWFSMWKSEFHDIDLSKPRGPSDLFSHPQHWRGFFSIQTVTRACSLPVPPLEVLLFSWLSPATPTYCPLSPPHYGPTTTCFQTHHSVMCYWVSLPSSPCLPVPLHHCGLCHSPWLLMTLSQLLRTPRPVCFSLKVLTIHWRPPGNVSLSVKPWPIFPSRSDPPSLPLSGPTRTLFIPSAGHCACCWRTR